MQARGRSPLDWSAPLVARARAAATPLCSRVGPFDNTHKILPLARLRRGRTAARNIGGSGPRLLPRRDVWVLSNRLLTAMQQVT